MRTLAVSFLLLAACGAERVTVEGLAPFDVRSEAWTRESDAHGDVEWIVLTNVEGYCEKARVADEAFVAAAAVSLEVDEETYCRDAKDAMQTWAAAMGELWFAGAHYLQVQPSGDGGPEDVAVGDWGGESTASALAGTLTYLEIDYYATWLDDWDADGQESDRCGVKSGNELGPLPMRDLETGLMTVATVEDATVATGEIEGTFAALDGEDVSVTVTATFEAEWCDRTGAE